ncbi:MAG TPA: Hsp33 family molecular chaperone HslO [Bacillales bacterium]|nr:Hsp33 family molecular chaperone HslO [Bacillales bacterium]
MKDYLVKALAWDGEIRAYAATTTNTVAEAQRRHDTWATASAALGRTMTAAAMTGAMLKDRDKLTVKVDGGGPLGPIIADADASGNVRGYVSHPHVHFDLNEKGKLDVARAVGKQGTLSVVKDLGLKQHFTGQVPLISGEIGEDFAYYFYNSEQVASSVGVGVLVNPDHTILAAGGVIVQMMPGASETTAKRVEQKIFQADPISKMVERGLTPEEILYEWLGEDRVKLLGSCDVSFECHCSEERIANGIVSLGEDEIQSMIDEDGRAEATCHFCRKVYTFEREQLERLKTESRANGR